MWMVAVGAPEPNVRLRPWSTIARLPTLIWRRSSEACRRQSPTSAELIV
jgi:hypothetical protein